MPRSKKLPPKIATGNIAMKTPEDSVYALFGLNDFPYKQKTQNEYLTYLRDLTENEIQRHAIEHGVIPNAVSRTILIDRLEREFLKKKFAYVNVKNSNPVTAKLSDKDEEDIADLLARGR
jgi:hypothetical protein